MAFKKKGIPEEGELVICTVQKVLFHSVFVSIDEYSNLEGMIHISEIAPGRIRNIRDYVREGKQVVCKVLSINHERKTIDLSLRRVSLQQGLKKQEEVKQEQKAEKILEQASKNLGIKIEEFYSKYAEKIIENYGTFYACFHDIVETGKEVLTEIGIPVDVASAISELVKERIKPQKVNLIYELTLESNADDGIDRIKKAILFGEEFAGKNSMQSKITYLGAPKYRLEVVASNFKDAESVAEKVIGEILGEAKKLGVLGSSRKIE